MGLSQGPWYPDPYHTSSVVELRVKPKQHNFENCVFNQLGTKGKKFALAVCINSYYLFFPFTFPSKVFHCELKESKTKAPPHVLVPWPVCYGMWCPLSHTSFHFTPAGPPWEVGTSSTCPEWLGHLLSVRSWIRFFGLDINFRILSTHYIPG